MTSLPAESSDPREDAPYLACRHFLFQKGSFREGGAGPPEGAGFCESPIGPIDALDCPLWLGRTCRFFEERTEDPVALEDEALAEARDRLREQYLRWQYRERVRRLAAGGVDPEPIDVTQLSPEEDARREDARRKKNEAKAQETGKKKRRRRRKAKKKEGDETSPSPDPDPAPEEAASEAPPSPAEPAEPAPPSSADPRAG